MTRQESRKLMIQLISRNEYQEKVNLDEKKIIMVIPDYVRHEDVIMGRV